MTAYYGWMSTLRTFCIPSPHFTIVRLVFEVRSVCETLPLFVDIRSSRLPVSKQTWRIEIGLYQNLRMNRESVQALVEGCAGLLCRPYSATHIPLALSVGDSSVTA